MNIRARIFARKITLIYFYEQYFVHLAGENAAMVEEIDKISTIVEPHPEEGTEPVNIHEVLGAYYGNVDDEIGYIITQHFSRIDSEDIDFSYIEKIAPLFFTYHDRVKEAVDEYATTFAFDDMDLMDRVIFVLGYVEFSVLQTPKEVVINEMIELAKRYGDDASPKLLNGIGHKVLTAIQENQ